MRDMNIPTSGCCSIPAARCPTLALSILAVTTSSRSMAMSMPVAAYASGSSWCSLSDFWTGAAPSPPPAAIAPGPAGLGAAAFFFPPALGAALGLEGAADSSSARRRAFSAFLASSALRFSSLSSCFLPLLAPSCHFSASFLSYKGQRRKDTALRDE